MLCRLFFRPFYFLSFIFRFSFSALSLSPYLHYLPITVPFSILVISPIRFYCRYSVFCFLFFLLICFILAPLSFILPFCPVPSLPPPFYCLPSPFNCILSFSFSPQLLLFFSLASSFPLPCLAFFHTIICLFYFFFFFFSLLFLGHRYSVYFILFLPHLPSLILVSP